MTFSSQKCLIHVWLNRACGTCRRRVPTVFPKATRGKPISRPTAGLTSQFSVSRKHIFAHSFLFGSVTVISSGLNSFQLRIPSLLRRWKGKHSFCYFWCQECLFTLLTISTVVTPWHPKNVPGPRQRAGWKITVQENSPKPEQCLGQQSRFLHVPNRLSGCDF